MQSVLRTGEIHLCRVKSLRDEIPLRGVTDGSHFTVSVSERFHLRTKSEDFIAASAAISFYPSPRSLPVLPPDRLRPAFMAKRDIAFVAAEKHLLAVGDYPALGVDTGVDYRLRAAGADRLDLGDRIRDLKESRAAREHVRQEIRAKPEAEHGDIPEIHYLPELVDMLGREKLALVGDYHVDALALVEQLADIVPGRDRESVRLQPDAGPYARFSVAVVGRRLDEPDLHTAFLVIELRYQRVGGL